MPQGRRVRRVIRKFDVWTVLRFGFLFNLSMFVVAMVTGLLLWAAASAVGAVDNVNEFLGDLLGLKLVASVIIRVYVLGGLVIALLGTGATVLMAVLYNLISDVVGGVEVTVLEDDGRRSGI